MILVVVAVVCFWFCSGRGVRKLNQEPLYCATFLISDFEKILLSHSVTQAGIEFASHLPELLRGLGSQDCTARPSSGFANYVELFSNLYYLVVATWKL